MNRLILLWMSVILLISLAQGRENKALKIKRSDLVQQDSFDCEENPEEQDLNNAVSQLKTLEKLYQHFAF